MQFKFIRTNNFKFDSGLIVLPCFDDELVSFKKLGLPEEILQKSNEILKEKKFTPSKGKTYSFSISLDSKIVTVILAGLGKDKNISLKEAVKVYLNALKKTESLNYENVFLALRPFENINYSLYAKSVIRSIIVNRYKFDKYLSEKDEESIKNISIILNENCAKDIKDTLIDDAILEADCMNYTRDLVNEPAIYMTPAKLAQKAEESAKKYGYEIEIFDKEYIKQMKMGAYLAVAEGSVNPPKLIVLRYKGNKGGKTYGLVGKGLCYDSGGYSIKPTSSMLDMKDDMAGSATVIGAMNLIAAKKLKINVTAVIAACENMISGGAYKPGDVIIAMDGTSIEIGNTDAEGRLTLADAITYNIQKENAEEIIELSTLTGAVVVALGEEISGVVTKNDDIYKELEEASKVSLDQIWQLPYYEEYRSLLKSDIADTNNTAGRYGGAITAGLFVTKFAKDIPMAHIDIAGTAWSEKSNAFFSKGATGSSVVMLYNYYKNKIK